MFSKSAAGRAELLTVTSATASDWRCLLALSQKISRTTVGSTAGAHLPLDQSHVQIVEFVPRLEHRSISRRNSVQNYVESSPPRFASSAGPPLPAFVSTFNSFNCRLSAVQITSGAIAHEECRLCQSPPLPYFFTFVLKHVQILLTKANQKSSSIL
jgi:hypothetical protein